MNHHAKETPRQACINLILVNEGAAEQQAADDLQVEQLRAENFEQGGSDL